AKPTELALSRTCVYSKVWIMIWPHSLTGWFATALDKFQTTEPSHRALLLFRTLSSTTRRSFLNRQRTSVFPSRGFNTAMVEFSREQVGATTTRSCNLSLQDGSAAVAPTRVLTSETSPLIALARSPLRPASEPTMVTTTPLGEATSLSLPTLMSPSAVGP